jgi:hypothetical protein
MEQQIPRPALSNIIRYVPTNVNWGNIKSVSKEVKTMGTLELSDRSKNLFDDLLLLEQDVFIKKYIYIPECIVYVSIIYRKATTYITEIEPKLCVLFAREWIKSSKLFVGSSIGYTIDNVFRILVNNNEYELASDLMKMSDEGYTQIINVFKLEYCINNYYNLRGDSYISLFAQYFNSQTSQIDLNSFRTICSLSKPDFIIKLLGRLCYTYLCLKDTNNLPKSTLVQLISEVTYTIKIDSIVDCLVRIHKSDILISKTNMFVATIYKKARELVSDLRISEDRVRILLTDLMLKTLSDDTFSISDISKLLDRLPVGKFSTMYRYFEGGIFTVRLSFVVIEMDFINDGNRRLLLGELLKRSLFDISLLFGESVRYNLFDISEKLIAKDNELKVEYYNPKKWLLSYENARKYLSLVDSRNVEEYEEGGINVINVLTSSLDVDLIPLISDFWRSHKFYSTFEIHGIKIGVDNDLLDSERYNRFVFKLYETMKDVWNETSWCITPKTLFVYKFLASKNPFYLDSRYRTGKWKLGEYNEKESIPLIYEGHKDPNWIMEILLRSY